MSFTAKPPRATTVRAPGVAVREPGTEHHGAASRFGVTLSQRGVRRADAHAGADRAGSFGGADRGG